MTTIPIAIIASPAYRATAAPRVPQQNEYASASEHIDKDVQLDEKKSKCGCGQAGTYPGKKGSLVRRVVGVVGYH
jgi:hypothetical protein